MATLFTFSAHALIGDNDAQLVAGDVAATPNVFIGRPGLEYDDTAEEAALTGEVEMPSQYTGSGLTAKIHFAMKSATSSNVRWDVLVEAKTPDTDTLDMEAASGWDSVNAGTAAVPGTAGNPSDVSITLTNADSVAVGDLVRFGIRRDCDHADDAASGDAILFALTIEDDG